MLVRKDSKAQELPVVANHLATIFAREGVLFSLQGAAPMLIRRYRGKELDLSQPPFKVDTELTLQLDIQQALDTYKKAFSKFEGASFKLYFLWTWVKAMQKVPEFNFRYIDGKWYEFKNLPLLTDVAANPDRPLDLSHLVIENPTQLSWSSMCQYYFEGKFAITQSETAAMYPSPIYSIATQVTSVSRPMSKRNMGVDRPTFLFGERRITDTEATMPLSVKLPHASLHPVLLEELIVAWKEEIGLAQQLLRPRL